MNRRSLLGDRVNGPVANVLGGIVILITLGLGLRLVFRALGVWP
jgi:manganese transport protein